MDGDQPLTADSNGNTAYYLYGLGAIGEKTADWAYSLPDGVNTPRQLADPTGDITLSARYTPWGDTLETHGTGNFTFGYFGGVMDAATGLLYVGNGQYYDPATGRFLTRNANPNSPNPYVPWNPLGALIGPLGLLALVFGRRKKGSRVGMLLVLLLVGLSVGMSLSACKLDNNSNTPEEPSNPVTPDETPSGPGYDSGDSPGTPEPAATIPEFVVCPEPEQTPTLTGTPTLSCPVCESNPNARMFLDAVLKYETVLKQTPGFSVAILLAMGAVETGGGGEGQGPYSNEIDGGVLQVKDPQFYGVSGTYDNTPQGYENNVKDAISTIKYFSKIDRENIVFSDLYNYYDAVEVDVARNVLYYNKGIGWWQYDGYFAQPKEAGYTGKVALMLSGVVPRDFGYSDDGFVYPMMSVQNAVSCELIRLYGEAHFAKADITCNK